MKIQTFGTDVFEPVDVGIVFDFLVPSSDFLPEAPTLSWLRSLAFDFSAALAWGFWAAVLDVVLFEVAWGRFFSNTPITVDFEAG